jgi:hypothetical protein
MAIFFKCKKKKKKKDIDRLAEQLLTALFVAARMQQSN